MADQSTDQTCHAKFQIAVNNVLGNFPHIVSLRKEQVDCLENLSNLVAGKDVFAILPTGFGKSLIFQLFPRIINMLNGRDQGTVSTIIVVNPLVAKMKDQVEQLCRKLRDYSRDVNFVNNNIVKILICT